MKTLQDVMMVFHESAAECPGMIVSDDTGKLWCIECGKTVGQLYPDILEQILDLMDAAQKTSSPR
jgi:hypothetical protein